MSTDEVPQMKSSPLVSAASLLSIASQFDRHVRLQPDHLAIDSRRLTLTYAQLDRRAWRLASVLRDSGVEQGDRICILSENDPDFLVLSIAALRLGATVAALNARLSPAELTHCIRLVTPSVLLISPKQRDRFEDTEDLAATVMPMGGGTPLDDSLMENARQAMDFTAVDSGSEDIQFIIYTSGTTGLPKAAMISQRAMLARLLVYTLDYGVDGADTFLAWSPLCHMASIELGFGTLLLGGKVVVMDGPDLPAICDYLENEKLSNLIFFPGMVDQAIKYLEERRPRIRGLKKFGALADLFSPRDIARLTQLLETPFTNTFGSTETGMPPLSGGRLAAGVVPTDFGKKPSSLCELRLFNADDEECAIGETGELGVRGPTVFSGYWAAPAATDEALRGGWFRTGDMFRLRPDGRYDYVDRRKYLIKSGGENIYPAEIERVVLQHPGIADAVVVRRADARWGEVPVVVAVARAEPPATEELIQLCAQSLASFKRPKDIIYVSSDFLPRSSTGKIMRSEVESWVARR
jgi:acyl-CoA synthetase (AMP-forming)/AMP-acid ligase II